MTKKIFIAAVMFISINSFAGPFGLNKGMTLEELKSQGAFAEGSEKNIYTSKALINGHPDFELYAVVLTPEQGLCKIHAAGKDIKSSSQGTELESEYKSLLEALSDKYGPPADKHDFLKAGSLWREPQYWMMGLLKKERVLSAYWNLGKNKKLPDSLQTIWISAQASSSDNGYITLTYEFSNFNDCQKILRSKKNSTL